MDIQKRTEISQDEVVRELARIAFSNGCDYTRVVEKKELDDEGREVMVKELEIINTDDLTESQRAAVASINIDRYGIKVSPYDKMKALELLGRHLGMFHEKPITGEVSAVQILDDINEQAVKNI